MGGRLTDRVSCEVPDCGHTMGVERYQKLFGHAPGTWICAFHWRQVPRNWKRVLNRHRRELRKYGFYPREAGYRRLWARIYRWLEL